MQCENKGIFFKLHKYKVLLSQYLIRTWLSFSWVWFIKKHAINIRKQLSLRNLPPKKRVIFAKYKLYWNSPRLTSLRLASPCLSFNGLPLFLETENSLRALYQAPAAPSHAPSPSFLPLCYVIPQTQQAPSPTVSSAHYSFGVGHSSLNCWSATSYPSCRS